MVDLNSMEEVNNEQWHLKTKRLPQGRTRSLLLQPGAKRFTVNPSCKGVLLFMFKQIFFSIF